MRWQLQEAKQRFSDLVRRTLAEGPQVVTRHGEDVVVVVPAQDYRPGPERISDFGEFLRAGPDFDLLEMDRSRQLPRDVELGE